MNDLYNALAAYLDGPVSESVETLDNLIAAFDQATFELSVAE